MSKPKLNGDEWEELQVYRAESQKMRALITTEPEDRTSGCIAAFSLLLLISIAISVGFLYVAVNITLQKQGTLIEKLEKRGVDE